ncbi:MAG: alpha/beta hydrolase fold domain-containing protein [Gammaproteobacteria bacterium]
MFFGGGWRQGSVQQFVPHAEHLANLGMVAIVADYRVLFRHGSNVAAAVADAKSAIRWVRSHAGDLGIDPNRIAAAGGSAGGHLAAAAAALQGFEAPGENLSVSSRPNALVLFNPAVNTGKIGDSRPRQFPGDAEALSPYHQAGGDFVPTLIQHGYGDTTVPYSDVQDFCDKLTRLAGDCTSIGYEEAEHGFFNKGVENDRWYLPTVEQMDGFLVRLGYLEEPGR